MISPQLDISVDHTKVDNDGRLVLLECSFCGSKYIIINIYAPTVDKTHDQKVFGEYLLQLAQKYKGDNIIIGGDFNINLTTVDQHVNPNNKSIGYLRNLSLLMEQLDLSDIWKIRHPDKVRYTRREKTRFGFKQSRIDHFLVSPGIEYCVKNTDILPGIRSDHSLLKLSLLNEQEQQRGRGIWKLNVSLLDDKNYRDFMKKVIDRAIKDCINLQDSTKSWDYIKCCIRTESISFSIKQNKDKKHKFETLEKRKFEVEEKLCTVPNPETLEEYNIIKEQLDELHNERAHGSFIRSRAKFIQEYEKPSKYFLSLEKANNKLNHIRALINNGTRYTNINDILELQKSYFSRIYGKTIETTDESNTEIDRYLKSIEIPTLSEHSRSICEQNITLKEIKIAVDNLSSNKSPGPDGIPIEFYKTFWPEIGELVFQSFINGFDKGELIDSQKQGIITLIPKKGKDLTDLKSWRPLSLLNTDYKIIAKTLGNRLRTVLTELISPDQVGYMQNRFCGENIRLIADTIDYCNHYKESCCIFLADFEKAFDTVKWPFLRKIMKYYGFGEHFQKWVSVLYKNSTSCVTNNGHVSSYFKLFKGIRQGCPISALLFLLVAEIIALILKQSDNVNGIHVANQEIKLCQLADDMTLFLTNIRSVRSAILLFEEFYRYSGLKLNKGKTEAVIIKGSVPFTKDESLGIKWIDGPFKTLGTWFSCENCVFVQLNTESKMNCIQNIIKSWQPRCLTLKGKITVVKSLVIPHILQLASVIPLSDRFIRDVDTLLLNFVWSNRKHLIAKKVLSLPYELGGLKMVSARSVIYTGKIMWIKRLLNDINANWKF